MRLPVIDTVSRGTFHLGGDVKSQHQTRSDVLTCSRRQVEDKYGQHAGEDAGQDDVDDVEERLPLYDEVEGDVLIQVLLNVLSGGFVTDGPFSVF